MHLSGRIALAVSVSLAVAAIPSTASGQNSGVLHACVKTNAGPQGSTLRMVAANEDCGKNETRIQWNVAGPQGSQGPQGPPGPPGPAGNAGAPEPMQGAAFQNAWQPVLPEHSPPGIEYEQVRFFKDASRVVHVQGTTITGDLVPALQTVFVLPLGYRPAARLIFHLPCSSASQTCRVDVAPNGDVIAVAPMTNGEFISFAGMSFRVAD